MPFSWNRKIQNISKNPTLYLDQNKITLPGLLWDTLYTYVGRDFSKCYDDIIIEKLWDEKGVRVRLAGADTLNRRAVKDSNLS